MEHRLQLCFVLCRDERRLWPGVGFRRLGRRMKRANTEDTIGPWQYLVAADLRLQQRCDEGRFPVALVVRPGVVGVVFNRIVEIPDALTRRTCDVLQCTILEESSLKRALGLDTLVDVHCAACAGPHLCDVSVGTDIKQR